MINRKQIYGWLDGVAQSDAKADFYDIAMMFLIMLSMVPLMFKDGNALLDAIDMGVTLVFVVDYVLRWCTADLKLRKGLVSFALYPVTPMAVLDMLSILPIFTPLATGFRLLRLARFLKALRVIRAFKMLRYSRSCMLIRDAIYNQRQALISAYAFAVFYLFVSALLVFNVEPQTFGNFWDALYWAAVSLTTVGYGDIYPVSGIGRCVTVLSSFVGIAIVALPAGIITAGYMSELSKSESVDRE